MHKAFLLLFTACLSACFASSLTLSGVPAPLIISSAIAGEEPSSVVDSTTSLTLLKENTGPFTVTVQLQEPLPEHTYLLLQAEDLGPKVHLSLSPQNLLLDTSDDKKVTSPLSYQYFGKVKAGPCPPKTITVFFTLFDASS